MITEEDKDKLIETLTLQLQEKEKELEELKDYIGCKGCIDLIVKTHQDKILFAVKQLNFVRESLLENLYDLYSKPSEIWEEYGDLYDVVITGGINKTIDNQIKQLKEGK